MEHDFVVTIQIPESLKNRLAFDWHCVTSLGRFPPLPRTPNINSILDQYITKAAPPDLATVHRDFVLDYVAGVKAYFNACVTTRLLYAEERDALKLPSSFPRQKLPKPVTAGSLLDWCSVFGAEHLLRFFVELPRLLVQPMGLSPAVSQLALSIILLKSRQLLEFLEEREEEFFTTKFVPISFAAEQYTSEKARIQAEKRSVKDEEDIH
ncbi:MRG like protein [Aduncisulcus paluster]|uniref:MRG like protein n=1 Tax=Aduncisulcus paluster TaxID=2918883 RepID=A0ABQ5KUR8_9EUKA|nr:MRG like protein [Aduncisulcus paluster]